MGYFESIASGFRHYVDFNGRALRSQYWWWTLFVIIISAIVNVIQTVISDGGMIWLSIVVSLALFLPGLSVAIRRLHDTNRSGWWFLLIFIPIIGWIILFIWYVSPGTEGENNYGPPIYT